MSMDEKNAFGIEKGLASFNTAADIGRLGRKNKNNPAVLDSVKRAKKDMPFSHKAVANVAQHPVASSVAGAGTTGATTAASIYGNQKPKVAVAKSDTGPFGVEVSKMFGAKKALKANQVASQMRKVGAQQGRSIAPAPKPFIPKDANDAFSDRAKLNRGLRVAGFRARIDARKAGDF